MALKHNWTYWGEPVQTEEEWSRLIKKRLKGLRYTAHGDIIRPDTCVTKACENSNVGGKPALFGDKPKENPRVFMCQRRGWDAMGRARAEYGFWRWVYGIADRIKLPILVAWADEKSESAYKRYFSIKP